MSSNILGVISLYSDYNTTFELITLTKNAVKTLAASDTYFWKRKTEQEVRYNTTLEEKSKWSTKYLKLNKHYFGNIYYQDETIYSKWSCIIKNSIKLFPNVVISTAGIHTYTSNGQWRLSLKGSQYSTVINVINIGSYIYILSSDGILFRSDIRSDISTNNSDLIRYNLSDIIDIKLGGAEYGMHIISAITRTKHTIHIGVDPNTGRILVCRILEELTNNISNKYDSISGPYSISQHKQLIYEQKNPKARKPKLPKLRYTYDLIYRLYDGPISCIGWYILGK